MCAAEGEPAEESLSSARGKVLLRLKSKRQALVKEIQAAGRYRDQMNNIQSYNIIHPTSFRCVWLLRGAEFLEVEYSGG